MTRMNRLVGLPIVQGGTRIGVVDAVSPTRCGRHLAGVHMQGRALRAGFIPADVIRVLGANAILVEDAPLKRTPRFALRRVRDTSGLKLGQVTDALVDENDLSIQAVEISFGPLDDLLRGRSWVRSYTVDPESGDVIVSCDVWPDREGGTMQ